MTNNSIVLQKRKRRAFFFTAMVGLLIAIPAGALWYLGKTVESEEFTSQRAVPDFLYQDITGQPFSKFDLEGNITIVAVLPLAANKLDPRSLQTVQNLTKYVENRLLYSRGTEVSPMRLVALTPEKQDLPPLWRQVISPIEAGILIPKEADLTTASWALIDQTPALRLWRVVPPSDNESGSNDLSRLESLLSRMVINHYMRDYLVKRTFFRREPKPVLDAG